MKFLNFMLMLLMFSPSVQAECLSSCERACYEQKYKCNIKTAYTYNSTSCADDLFTCQASCKTGKKQNFYASKLPVRLALKPTWEFD